MNINMHTSHPSAFISSTFVDLFEDRKAVAKALKARGLNVNALDIKPASNQSSQKEIINGIRESDFVILIIGDRYGSILESMTGSTSDSITLWEYKMAHKLKKPVICFFKNVDGTKPSSHDEVQDPKYKLKRKRFEHFKKMVTHRHNPSFYTEPSEIAEQVDESLIKTYRDGVKDLRTQSAGLREEKRQLELEVDRLKSQIAPTSNNARQNLLTLGLGGNVFANQTKDTAPSTFDFAKMLTKK